MGEDLSRIGMNGDWGGAGVFFLNGFPIPTCLVCTVGKCFPGSYSFFAEHVDLDKSLLIDLKFFPGLGSLEGSGGDVA